MPEKPITLWSSIATIAAVSVAVTLCVVKIYAWLVTGSAAVLGSLADSAFDLISSLAATLTVLYAALPPDHNHRFGHRKAEGLTALLQVVLISSSAAIVAFESGGRLLNPVAIENPPVALGVMTFSLLATLALVALQTYALKKSGSLVVRGDRLNYLGDVLANSGALAAVWIASSFDLPRADAIAGLMVAMVLIMAGWQIARRAIPQLMDEELPDADKQIIQKILSADPDIIDFHALRTRQAGDQRFIQLDIQIDADLTFREAHAITDRIELAIEAAFSDADVIVHPDPIGEARLERRVLDKQAADSSSLL
ncbi:MAG: cation diffusion facilitator family transporter [Pseudomonadota bacterium]